jgi:enoyl-CoA hydratase/3-hydroxyacyl-CoA dehydrogenase
VATSVKPTACEYVDMDAAQVNRVTVLGAGTMGREIAGIIATAGYEVTMMDEDESAIHEAYDDLEWRLKQLADNRQLGEAPEAIMDRVNLAMKQDEAVQNAELVIEAIPEDLTAKRELFEAIESAAPSDAVFATTTTTLSISDLAHAIDDPGRLLGLHFFYPPARMDLVEVVQGGRADESVASLGVEFVESIDKTPIHVRGDVRGFVVNTVLAPFVGEPAWMVSAHEATIREADAAMVHRRGYPMGPFEHADRIGLDSLFRLYRGNDSAVPPVLAEKVDSDLYGRKSGQGFYVYDDTMQADSDSAPSGDDRNTLGPDYQRGDGHAFDWFRVEARMANEAARLVGDRVATPAAIDTGMRLGAGFPHGICQRADELGLERILETLEARYEETGEARYEPADFLTDLVDSGRTGVAAGAGFHDYDEEKMPASSSDTRDSTSSS